MAKKYYNLDKMVVYAPKHKKTVVFVAHCLLNQYSRAIGVKNCYKEDDIVPGTVKPLVNLLNKYNVAIVQMPCPEVFYEGLIRRASGQTRYNTEKYKEVCRRIAKDIIYLIEQYYKNGYKILIIGVDGSPSCGVTLTALGGGKWANDRGIFMRILEEELKKKGYNIPIVGARLRSPIEINRFLKDVERQIK